MSKKMQDLLLVAYLEKVEKFLKQDYVKGILLKTLTTDKYSGCEIRVVVDDNNELSINGISNVNYDDDPHFKKILSIGFDYSLELDIKDYEEVVNKSDMEYLLFELKNHSKFENIVSTMEFGDLLNIDRKIVEFVIVNGFNDIYEKAYLRKAANYIDDYIKLLLLKTMDNLREILKREF